MTPTEALKTQVALPGLEIVRTIHGSHLYGTNGEGSDVDVFGIYLPAGEDVLLGQVRHSVRVKTEELDMQFLSLSRFMQLLLEGQTIAVETLWAPTPINNLHSSAARMIWAALQSHRTRLVSRSAAAFVGYCQKQAHKYSVKGQRMAEAKLVMAEIARHPPTQTLQSIQGTMEPIVAGAEHVAWATREVSPGREIVHLSVCDRLMPVTITLREASARVGAILAEYGKRAEQAMTNDNVDWKAVMHATRVGMEAIELFTYGRINFPLSSAPVLRKIRDGAFPLAEIEDLLEQLMGQALAAAANSRHFSAEPDREKAKEILLLAHRRAVTDVRIVEVA